MKAVWGGRQGAAALAVIASMVVWRSVLLAESFFNQDDYFFIHRALDADLSFDYLVLTPNAGHVNPLQQLTFWIAARTAPFEWGVYAGFLVLAQALTTIVLWHVLSRLLPGRWVRLALLAAFAWSPLTLMTSLWWAAAICLWPHLFCSLLAVLHLVRWRQGVGRTGVNLAVILLATVTGLLWHERAVLIAPVLVATAVLLADEASGWRRLPAALHRFRWLWGALVVLFAGFLVAHRSITSVEGGESDVSESLRISWAFVGQNVLPGLASGPWSATLTGGAVEPRTWVTVVSLVLFVLVVGVVLRCGGPARRWALLFFVGYVVSDLTLVLAGRSGFGRVIGLDPRYASDILHAAVLALAFALRDAPQHYGVRLPSRVTRPTWLTWTRGRSLVLGVAVGAYLVGSAFGSAALVPHFQNPGDRAYVTNLREDLAADPNQVLVDALAPADIVLPLVGDDSLLSRVLAPLPEDPVFDEPSPRMRVVGPDGRLVPVVLDGTIPMRPGPEEGCGYPVTDEGEEVRLAVEIAGRVVVRVGYFTDRESTVEITSGEWSSQFLARSGPNQLWFTLPDQGEPLTSLGFRVEGPATVCVAELEAGLPRAP